MINNNGFYEHTYYGIFLASRDNNVVKNEFVGNEKGIYVYGGYGHTIEANVFKNNGVGVYIDPLGQYHRIQENDFEGNDKGVSVSGDNNFVEKNMAQDCNWGIYLVGSNNRIENNTLTYNVYAIGLRRATGNQLHYNIMKRNGIYIYGTSESHYTSHVIPTTNKINNRPVYYYVGEMGNLVVPSDAGEVILGGASNITVKDIDFDYTGLAMIVGYSSNVNIQNIRVNYGPLGIFLRSSVNVTVEGSRFENLVYGLHTTSTSKSVFSNNVFLNNTYGMHITSSSNWNGISNNIVRNNSDSGIYLSSSDHNTISGGDIEYNNYGIFIYGSSYNNTITGIDFVSNSNYAVHIYHAYATRNRIYENFFYYNHGSGDEYDSSHVQAYDNGRNFWNPTSGIGNYWRDWANNNDTNDRNNNGIVDWPYALDGSTGSRDYYPLKKPMAPPELVPSRPGNLTAEEGAGYVNLSWEAPASNGSSEITEYKIYRNGTHIATVPATQLWYNDTSITPEVTYTYHVTAVNSVGESEGSNQVEATPTGAIPELSWLMAISLVFLALILRRKRIFHGDEPRTG